MPKKYDTNPLDPEFPEKVTTEQHTQTLPYSGAETRKFSPPDDTEEQTRQFSGANFASYASPYGGQNIPANYQTANLADMNSASSRKVDKIGLPEKFMIMLPYLPFWLGLIAGLVELLIVPKSEQKVRFHAAQGLAAHVAILIISAILAGIGNVSGVARAGNGIFTVATTIMLIIFAVKAWKGKPVHIESVDDLTSWLEEKIQIKDK